ncbi:MAG: hypothetical protein JXR84_04280 [Anaerolineae bacterium]|nr:hypothetical protein [Anaerolineae bacterium]
MGGRLNPVEYLVHTGETSLQLPAGKAYGYVMAGNGVFKIAHTAEFEACIPVAPGHIAGLGNLTPYLWMEELLDVAILRAVLMDARNAARHAPREAMYHVVKENGKAKVYAPQQRATAGGVWYEGGSASNVLLDIHSHCEMGAFFSSVDNRDEQGLRLYGVIGKIFTRPEVRLRVGIYGDFWPVEIEDVFGGMGR